MSFLGQEKTIEISRGWSPSSCKDKVKKINNLLKSLSLLSIDHKKECEMTPDLEKEGQVVSTSSRRFQIKAQRTTEDAETSQDQSRQVQSQTQLEHTLPTRVKDPQIGAFSHGQCIQYGQSPYVIHSPGKGKDEQEFFMQTRD
ncbi:hypothetical protein O181_039398 [Austropuccinia psidii MF-1]|uniref:Uncharacterized protein n=1 Tax=Austropuccinia psidii MF-1 TaxID=1389203 RepID=A0A9Q3DDB9_9BASI|nr:hypothetical protein [Austropuccinia psidii MF-1]